MVRSRTSVPLVDAGAAGTDAAGAGGDASSAIRIKFGLSAMPVSGAVSVK
jgi:hypothetical protein